MTLRAGAAKLVGAALAGSLLIFVAPAAAKPCQPQAPGGNSEISQYLETIPGACGDQPIPDGQGSPGTSGTGSGPSAAGFPPGTISQLESLGPEGAQAASFAESTAPSGPAGAGGDGGSRSAAAESGATSDGGGSLLSALERLLIGSDASASGGQGLGTWLPILLVAVLLGGFGTLALRRARTG
jgi:hypothetical protein